MAEHEWLCLMLMSLDDFASSKNMQRFRKALSDAADAAWEDISEASHLVENVIPFPKIFPSNLNPPKMYVNQEPTLEKN
jgi:hypothetical protein